jgi:hypothetical protein
VEYVIAFSYLLHKTATFAAMNPNPICKSDLQFNSTLYHTNPHGLCQHGNSSKPIAPDIRRTW